MGIPFRMCAISRVFNLVLWQHCSGFSGSRLRCGARKLRLEGETSVKRCRTDAWTARYLWVVTRRMEGLPVGDGASMHYIGSRMNAIDTGPRSATDNVRSNPLLIGVY